MIPLPFTVFDLDGHIVDDAMLAYGRACAAAERERCAKLIEKYPYLTDELGDWGARGDAYPQEHSTLAAAIRALKDDPPPSHSPTPSQP